MERRICMCGLKLILAKNKRFSFLLYLVNLKFIIKYSVPVEHEHYSKLILDYLAFWCMCLIYVYTRARIRECLLRLVNFYLCKTRDNHTEPGSDWIHLPKYISFTIKFII